MKIQAHALELATIPLRVTGRMEHPDVAFDAAAALSGVIAAPEAAASALVNTPGKAGKTALDALGGLGGLVVPKK